MYIYKTTCVDPRYNLAIEEYLTKAEKYDQPILFLWQNDNTIVVGRNQNSVWEINLQKAQNDGVTIIRRNTGGGTVFHDLGNLNFSIIYTDKDNKAVSLFSEMLKPVISTLNEMGAAAEFSGRNDIVIKGKKISGNAMWKHKERFLQHGTILFNANLDKLTKYLTVDRSKILSKNIESIAARVTNVNQEVENKIEIDEFMNRLIETYKKTDDVTEIVLTKDDLAAIEEIFKKKYCNPDWTFSKNETFSYRNKNRFEGKGTVEVFLEVKKGVIEDAKIYGDFLGFAGTEELEERLIGTKYNTKDLEKVLEEFDIKDIFGENFTNQDILDLLIQ